MKFINERDLFKDSQKALQNLEGLLHYIEKYLQQFLKEWDTNI